MGIEKGGPGGLPPALFLPISREKWGPPPGRRGPRGAAPRGLVRAWTTRRVHSTAPRPRPGPGGQRGAAPRGGFRGTHSEGTQHRAASGRGAGLGPSQVQTCNVVSRPAPGGSPAFSGESRRKERRGPCPLDPLFLWPARFHSLVLAWWGAAKRSLGYFVTHVRALIWGTFSCGATQPRGFPLGGSCHRR